MSDIHFVKRNIKIVSVAGLWEYGDIKEPFKTLFYIYGKILFVFFFLFNITQFIEIYNIGNDILLLMGNAGVSLMYFVTVLKSYTLHFRKNRVENLFQQIRDKEQTAMSKNTDIRQLYEECSEENAFVTTNFCRLGLSTLVMFYIARPAEFYLMGPQKIHGYKIPLTFRYLT